MAEYENSLEVGPIGEFEMDALSRHVLGISRRLGECGCEKRVGLGNAPFRVWKNKERQNELLLHMMSYRQWKGNDEGSEFISLSSKHRHAAMKDADVISPSTTHTESRHGYLLVCFKDL